MRRLATAGCVMLLAAALLTGCNTSKKAEEATTQTKAETESITVDYGKGLNEDGTLADIDPTAYVTVCEYKGIKIKKDDITASDDEVQAQIDALMASFQTTNEIKDRAVEDGDVVNIDFTGKVDGKEFDGGSGQGYDLTIGSGTFIDNFEEQLIGHNPGETVEVKVKFPDDYQSENLAGKDAVFTTVINYISEKEDAKLNDEFVKENLSEEPYGFTSVKDMKTKIKDNLETNRKESYVWDYLTENSTFNDNMKEVVDKQLDLMVEGAKAESQAQNLSFEDYLSSNGLKDEQALRDAYYDRCEEIVKTYLVSDVIAGQENISVTEDDVKKFFNGQDYSSYIELYSQNYINRAVLNSLVADFVVENATIE
jgi:trigger factor